MNICCRSWRFASPVFRSLYPTRFSYSIESTAIPRITMPHKVMKTLEKQNYKQSLKQHQSQRRAPGHLVIACKRPQFNHYSGQSYSEFSPQCLASGGWKHMKSKGDHFTINAVQGNPAFEHGNDSLSFDSFGFQNDLVDALKKFSVVKPTIIQNLTIPLIMEGKNVLCAAETGSGKTLAFLLPMIEKVKHFHGTYGHSKVLNQPIGIILTPSRELADQIYGLGKKCGERLCAGLDVHMSVAKDLSEHVQFSVDVKCGGRKTQHLLRQGPEKTVDILIATPGVLSKLLTNKLYDLSRLALLVLDEADTLFDDSFSSLTTRLIQKLKIASEKPAVSLSDSNSNAVCGTQIVLVGATIPKSLDEKLGEIVAMDTVESVTTKHLHRLLPHVAQKFVRLGPSQKPEHLLAIIKSNEARRIPTLIFCNKSNTVCFLGHLLTSNNIKNLIMHADMPQIVREGRYEQFQNGEYDILICTDIASRGLDTVRAHHVINYEFPNFMSDYVHRIGRVGRIGSPLSCFALSYISYLWDVDLLWEIEASARQKTELHNVNANIKRKLVGIAEKKLLQQQLMTDVKSVNDEQ